MSGKSFPEKAVNQIKNATQYSLDGLRYMLTNEMAARMEFYLFFWGTVLLLVMGAPARVFLITTVLFLILIAVEALNTAIEVIIDKISPQISATGKHAKDLGSFAVMCLLIVNGIYFINALINTPRMVDLLAMLSRSSA